MTLLNRMPRTSNNAISKAVEWWYNRASSNRS